MLPQTEALQLNYSRRPSVSPLPLLILLLLTSCGYRGGQGEAPWLGSTISVPYVEGDTDGQITASLIRQIQSSGLFRYVDRNGCHLLKVKVVECRDENTGFRYDQVAANTGDDGDDVPGQESNQGLTNTLIPIESRKWILVQVEVFAEGCGEPIAGPVCISAFVDYDHGYHLLSNQLNVFSIGQLTDISVAGEVVARPLSEAVARSVVDYLLNAW